ncbi:MAG: hypothetical protein JW938_07670 [Candidatus Omnitrophica bacterium]|nr:hypothetical protein [Candidatus Omnitrophota bacterium]
MKKLVIIISILCLISSVAYADKGAGRAVKREVIEKQVVQEEPQVQVIEREAPRPVQQERIVTPAPMPVQQAPVVQQKAEPDFDALYHEVGCTCALCEWCASDNYGVKFGGQFLRGLLNAATCWVEIPVTTYERSVNGTTPFIDPVTGLAEGSARTVLRAASGVIDVATSWIPMYKNQLIFKSKPTLICD